jgi:hypothetical protein
MSIAEALNDFAVHSPERHVGKLQESIPAELVRQALNATGTATVRTRRLPAEAVLWLVIAMAMYRNMSIDAVVGHLDLALPEKDGKDVARSAISEARGKLGPEPLQWLLRVCAARWWEETRERAEARWRGLNLLGLDGTTFRLPDSPGNRARFGGHFNGAQSAFPTVRMVALFALATHLVLDAVFDGLGKGESTLSVELLQKIPAHSLIIVDRLFRKANLLIPLQKMNNVHFLTRAPEKRNWKVIRTLGRGDFLVEVKVASKTRKAGADLPSAWVFRVIEYRRKGREGALCTSLLDPVQAPAKELVELYHQRWEIELAYDEVKTEMLQREETLRSLIPERVEQEIWGLLMAFNLVRVEMARIATEAGVAPTRISFVAAYQRMQLLWVTLAALKPARLPEELLRVRTDIRRFVLPKRRSERTYPRAVKTFARKYPKLKAVK